MNLAIATSLRSEDPHVRVGAAVADRRHRVLGTGYNGLPAGKTLSPTQWADRDGRRGKIIHAELNALGLVRHGDGHVMACTLSPCLSCAHLIVAHGVKRLLYAASYARDGGEGLDFLKWAGVKVIHVPNALDKFVRQTAEFAPVTDVVQ